jgi:hypothetical protein
MGCAAEQPGVLARQRFALGTVPDHNGVVGSDRFQFAAGRKSSTTAALESGAVEQPG